MLKKSEIAYYYYDLRAGKRQRLLNEIFTGSERRDEAIAIDFLKYIIEDVLYWTPQEAYKFLTFDLLDNLSVGFIKDYVQFPDEFDKHQDPHLLVIKAYPSQFKVSLKEQTIIAYKRYLRGEVKTLSPSFFLGTNGEKKACWCLKWAIDNSDIKNLDCPEELFRFFSMKKCEMFLKRYKLLEAAKSLYEYNVDFLFYTFPEGQRNDPRIRGCYAKYRAKSKVRNNDSKPAKKVSADQVKP